MSSPDKVIDAGLATHSLDTVELGQTDNSGMTEFSWTKLVPEVDCEDSDDEHLIYLFDCFERLELSAFDRLGPDVALDFRAGKISSVYLEHCSCKECNGYAREKGELVWKQRM